MRTETRIKRKFRKPGYVAAIIFEIIFFYIVNHLLDWGVPFLTESFEVVLWLVNLSLFAGIVGNLLLLVYDPRWFRHLATMVMNVFSFAAIYTLLVIFPFAFEADPWPLVARLMMIFILIGIAIGTVVEFFRLIFGRD